MPITTWLSLAHFYHTVVHLTLLTEFRYLISVICALLNTWLANDISVVVNNIRDYSVKRINQECLQQDVTAQLPSTIKCCVYCRVASPGRLLHREPLWLLHQRGNITYCSTFHSFIHPRSQCTSEEQKCANTCICQPLDNFLTRPIAYFQLNSGVQPFCSLWIQHDRIQCTVSYAPYNFQSLGIFG